jgi:two-component system, LytTR family, response regulator
MPDPSTSPTPNSSPPAPARTCVIIDDEKRGREYLSNILSRHFPEIREVGQAKSVDEGIALIESAQPDIIFLDIEIIGGTGFDVLDRVQDGCFVVVFITAYANYRNETDRYPNARFLLKPIGIAGLKEALDSFNREKPSESTSDP